MTSIIDIGPLTEEVTIRGHKAKVRGISAETIFTLCAESPELRKVLSEKAIDGDIISGLVNMAGTACAQIIACGIGERGNDKAVAWAMTLTAGETSALLKPILGLTFPQGLKAFTEELVALVSEATGRDVKLGWGQDTKSPGPSRSASKAGTQQSKPGDTPQDNLVDGAH
jgi:hypothetical protein